MWKLFEKCVACAHFIHQIKDYRKTKYLHNNTIILREKNTIAKVEWNIFLKIILKETKKLPLKNFTNKIYWKTSKQVKVQVTKDWKKFISTFELKIAPSPLNFRSQAENHVWKDLFTNLVSSLNFFDESRNICKKNTFIIYYFYENFFAIVLH